MLQKTTHHRLDGSKCVGCDVISSASSHRETYK